MEKFKEKRIFGQFGIIAYGPRVERGTHFCQIKLFEATLGMA
jgi:hypothetical protein